MDKTLAALLADVKKAFIQETGSVIQWFKMPKEDRLNYWKASIKADHKDTTTSP